MALTRRIALALGAAAVLSLAGFGIAQAAIPDNGGVIHGCYKPQTDGHSSALGVIDTALSNGHCPSGNTEVTWNQTGPQGPTGATGPQGPAGASATFYQVTGVTQVQPGDSGVAVARCTLGDHVTGGGFQDNTGVSGVAAPYLYFSGPENQAGGTNDQWVVRLLQNDTGTSFNLFAYAECEHQS